MFGFQKEKPVGVPETPDKKVTRLAIGIEGGFDATSNGVEYELEEIHSVVVFPGNHVIQLPNDELPEKVCVLSLIKCVQQIVIYFCSFLALLPELLLPSLQEELQNWKQWPIHGMEKSV
jgi:hypothetical protein